MKLQFKNRPFENGITLFSKNHLSLSDNSFNVLIGCNGCGKSILLKILNDRYENRKGYLKIKEENVGLRLRDTIYLFKYDNNYKPSEEDNNFISSGEKIINYFGNSMALLSNFVNCHKYCKLLILIDDADFSLSVDYIQNIKDALNSIINDCKKNQITYYILFASNSYEICKENICIQTHNFKKCKVKNYEVFKQKILESRDYINNQLNMIEGDNSE